MTMQIKSEEQHSRSRHTEAVDRDEGISVWVSDYRGADGTDTPPSMQLNTGGGGMLTRAKWETLKRMGDAAWNEYERQWGGK